MTQKCIWLVILLTTVATVMPVVAFRFLKVDVFPTLNDQVCRGADEYLNGWLLALEIMSYSAWKPREELINFPLETPVGTQHPITAEGTIHL